MNDDQVSADSTMHNFFAIDSVEDVIKDPGAVIVQLGPRLKPNGFDQSVTLNLPSTTTTHLPHKLFSQKGLS